MPLKTDYKNFIPSTTTKIHDIKQASDGTVINADVILEDVTIYSQEGDAFGSADINATNAQVNANTDAIALKAPLSSPEFTDIPKAPTAPTGTDTTQIASTEFVQQELDVHKAESALKHITESGSNANGQYIKFDDGTAMCFREITESGISPSINSKTIEWTFPVALISGEYGFSGIFWCIEEGAAFRDGILTTSQSNPNNGLSIQVRGLDISSGAFNSYRFKLFVVGRWK